MNIHGAVVDVLKLANVAAGKVFPTFDDVDDQSTEYVIVTRSTYEPIGTLIAQTGMIRSVMVMQCWARQKARAMEIAKDAANAMEADNTLPIKVQEQPADSEDFTPDVMELMEPVQYSIWHDA